MLMERPKLLERWESVFGRLPPPHTHASFMRLALAWQNQTGRKTWVATNPSELPAKSRRASGTLSPGTRLIRKWQGETYHVMVTAAGFDHGGKTYKSLTAIAKAITGTQWSGPAFFGVGR
jgi:hypothetical protein